MKNKQTRLLFVSLPVENQAITDLANTVINDPSVKLDAPDFAAFTPKDIFTVKTIAEMLYDNLSVNPKATILAGLDAALSFNGNKATKKQIEGVANLALLCDKAFEHYITKFRLDVDRTVHDDLAKTIVKLGVVKTFTLNDLMHAAAEAISAARKHEASLLMEVPYIKTLQEMDFTPEEVAKISPAGKKYFGGMKSPRPSKSKK